MIGRPACGFWFNARKTKLAKIKLIDEDVNHAHCIILSDVIVQQFWEECALGSIFTLNKTPHVNASTLNAIFI